MPISARKVWSGVTEDVYLVIKCEDLDMWRY